MSLEQTLERIADALEKRNELLASCVAEPTTAEKPAPKKKKAKAEEPEEVVEEKPKKKKAKAKKEEPKTEDIHAKKYYKETVQPITRKAAGLLGKDVVLGILDEFGTELKNAKDLEEDQWEDYVARLEQEIQDHVDADEEDDEDLS